MHAQLDVPSTWKTKIEDTRMKEEQIREEKERYARTAILDEYLERNPNKSKTASYPPPEAAFRRRYKRTQVAGLFAQAKKSFSRKRLYEDDEDTNYKDNNEEPYYCQKVLRNERTPFPTWTRPQVSKPKPINIRRENSDEEKEKPSSTTTRLPSPKKESSESEDEPIDERLCQFIAHVSANFGKRRLLPKLYVHEKNQTTISELETKVLHSVVNRNESDPPCNLPIMDLISERADWLLYDEELNDKNDYKPKDAHFTTDILSKRHEEFVKRSMEKDFVYPGADFPDSSDSQNEKVEQNCLSFLCDDQKNDFNSFFDDSEKQTPINRSDQEYSTSTDKKPASRSDSLGKFPSFAAWSRSSQSFYEEDTSNGNAQETYSNGINDASLSQRYPTDLTRTARNSIPSLMSVDLQTRSTSIRYAQYTPQSNHNTSQDKDERSSKYSFY